MLVLPAVVADLSLRPGMDIPDAARASLEAAAGSASAKERAVRILSAATVSRAELEHPSAPEGRIARERQAGRRMARRLSLLDDEAAARQIVRSGTAKGYGAARIPADALRQAHPARAVGRRLLPSSRSRTTRSTHFYRSGSAAGSRPHGDPPRSRRAAAPRPCVGRYPPRARTLRPGSSGGIRKEVQPRWANEWE